MKEVSGLIKLQIKGGAANPAPPIGPALGQKGVNIMEFCKQFNARTQDQAGKVLPVIITVYKDKSFDFIVKASPVAASVLEAAKIAKKNAGNIDILINCAGIVANNKTFDEQSVTDITRTMNINAVAPMLVTLQFLPDMLKRNFGDK